MKFALRNVSWASPPQTYRIIYMLHLSGIKHTWQTNRQTLICGREIKYKDQCYRLNIYVSHYFICLPMLLRCAVRAPSGHMWGDSSSICIYVVIECNGQVYVILLRLTLACVRVSCILTTGRHMRAR